MSQLLLVMLILSQNPLGAVVHLFFHLVIYLPSPQLAYVTNHIVLLQLLRFLNAQIYGYFFLIPFMIYIRDIFTADDVSFVVLNMYSSI